MSETGPPPTALRTVAVIIWLQAVALGVLALIVVYKTLTGDPHSPAGALADAAMALVGAAALALCGCAILGLRPAARTPVVVIELVALPVSYTLAFEAHRAGYGAPILLSAVAVLYLLFTPSSRAALDREI